MRYPPSRERYGGQVGLVWMKDRSQNGGVGLPMSNGITPHSLTLSPKWERRRNGGEGGERLRGHPPPPTLCRIRQRRVVGLRSPKGRGVRTVARENGRESASWGCFFRTALIKRCNRGKERKLGGRLFNTEGKDSRAGRPRHYPPGGAEKTCVFAKRSLPLSGGIGRGCEARFSKDAIPEVTAMESTS